MAALVEHLNEVTPQLFPDLRDSEFNGCLSPSAVPVMATPCITYAVGVTLAVATYVTGEGGGCSSDGTMRPC